MNEHERNESIGPSPDPALERELEAWGRRARSRSDLISGVFERSVEHLPAPRALSMESYQSGRVSTWTRVALAASLLLACAVVARLFLTGGIDGNLDPTRGELVVENVQDDAGPFQDELPSERDTVLVALLDAGSNGRIEAVEYLEGSDAVGAAFAPILGTTGFGMDDFAAEIRSIEGDLRR